MTNHEPADISPVDIIRSIYDAYESGDAGTPATHFVAEAEGYVSDFLPWGGYRRGMRELAQGLATLRRYVTDAFEPNEFVDADDHVVASGQTVGFLNATAQAFSVRTVHVWHFAGSKIIRFENYLDRDLAAYLPEAETQLEPTSVSPVEIARCIYDAYESGDTRTLREHFDRDIEVFAPEFLPEGGWRRGFQELRQGVDAIRRFVSTAFEPSEFVDAGDHVVAIGRTVGLVHATSQPFSIRTVHVLRFEGAKIVRFENYIDRAMVSLLTDAA